PFSLQEALETVQATVGAWAMTGCRTLLLGGDHSLTLGALRALALQHGPLGLLHIDAHPDAAQGATWGTEIHHGTWLRQALEENLVDPERVVQAGLRAPRHDDEELAFLQAAGVRMWTPADLRDPLLALQLKEDLGSVGRGPAYLSLDLDALDPILVPAVAEPVPGGLSLAETLRLLHAARLWPEPWVGADLMELAPTLEGAEGSARVAVHLALHLLA
ncbi:MAG TPA: arginase family protein, partial [Geothrix sp.]|nr:arginase family protein [Geothrix sp.]